MPGKTPPSSHTHTGSQDRPAPQAKQGDERHAMSQRRAFVALFGLGSGSSLGSLCVRVGRGGCLSWDVAPFSDF